MPAANDASWLANDAGAQQGAGAVELDSIHAMKPPDKDAAGGANTADNVLEEHEEARSMRRLHLTRQVAFSEPEWEEEWLRPLLMGAVDPGAVRDEELLRTDIDVLTEYVMRTTCASLMVWDRDGGPCGGHRLAPLPPPRGHSRVPTDVWARCQALVLAFPSAQHMCMAAALIGSKEDVAAGMPWMRWLYRVDPRTLSTMSTSAAPQSERPGAIPMTTVSVGYVERAIVLDKTTRVMRALRVFTDHHTCVRPEAVDMQYPDAPFQTVLRLERATALHWLVARVMNGTWAIVETSRVLAACQAMLAATAPDDGDDCTRLEHCPDAFEDAIVCCMHVMSQRCMHCGADLCENCGDSTSSTVRVCAGCNTARFCDALCQMRACKAQASDDAGDTQQPHAGRASIHGAHECSCTRVLRRLLAPTATLPTWPDLLRQLRCEDEGAPLQMTCHGEFNDAMYHQLLWDVTQAPDRARVLPTFMCNHQAWHLGQAHLGQPYGLPLQPRHWDASVRVRRAAFTLPAYGNMLAQLTPAEEAGAAQGAATPAPGPSARVTLRGLLNAVYQRMQQPRTPAWAVRALGLPYVCKFGSPRAQDACKRFAATTTATHMPVPWHELNVSHKHFDRIEETLADRLCIRTNAFEQSLRRSGYGWAE